MDDTVIQHHFDEVFMALQDVENFEIFSRLRKGNTPKVNRTLVKIIHSDTQKNNPEPDSDPAESAKISDFSVEIKNILKKGSSSIHNEQQNNSRTSPRQSRTQKCETSFSKLNPSVNLNASKYSNKSLYKKRIYKTSLTTTNKVRKMENTISVCKFCGRYILGDFLEIHQEKCRSENF